MSVDKFGRHVSTIKVQRETKRSLHEDIGIDLTADGDVDVENKRICNLGNPIALYDAVPLHVVQERCLLLPDEGNGVDVKGYKLHNVDSPIDRKDGVNKEYVKNMCLCYGKSREGDLIVDAHNHRITAVGTPVRAKDAVNKYYLDQKSIQRDEKNNLMVENYRITQLAPPVNKTDAVNLEYLRNNVISLKGNSFNANGNKITNLVDGNSDTDAVNIRQMHDFKRDGKSELHKIVKILQTRIDKIVSYIYKLHAHTARSSLDAEESELKLRDNAETIALIKQIDREIVSDDWRSLFS